MKAKEFDKMFDDDQEDLLEHLDLSTAKRSNHVQKRVNSADEPRNAGVNSNHIGE